MRPLRTPLLVALLALLVPLLIAAGPTDTALGDGAAPTVHPQLAADLAAAPADAQLEVVVTAWDRSGLQALDRAGVRHRKLVTMPIALAHPTVAQLETLAADTRVRSLWPVESFDLFLDEGTAMVGADRVASDLGVRGEGVTVAVIDTGLDTTHPDLDGDKVLGNFQVVGDLDGPVLIESPFTDDHGHGTHVASTVAGDDDAKDDANGDMSGVAPKANLYGYAINAGASVLSELALLAFDDLIQRRQAGEPIVAASNSWGGGDGTYSPADPLAVATRALVDNGIVPVFAAGNSGPGLETASNQCTIPWTFCVGAITKGRTIAGFSSRGRPPTPTTEVRPDGVSTAVAAGNHDVALGQALELGVYRPNVSAPGVDIEAACSTAAGCPGGYQLMSGTSMATPHVSGVIALVQSARLAAGGDLLSAHEVTSLVENTANRMPGYELWEIGTGEVDALEAVQLVTAAGTGDVAIPTANYGATRAEAGDESLVSQHTGEVLPNSWQTGEGAYVDTFEVGDGVGSMTALLTWPRPTDNIYLNLYAPGLVPGEDPPTAQSAGLLDGNLPYTRRYRELEVHFPEAGQWHLEVHGRVNGPTDATVAITRVPTERPVVTIDGSGLAGTTDAGSLVSPSTGVTRDSVSGTAQPLAVTGTPTPYFLHSTVPVADGLLDGDVGSGPSMDTTEPAIPASKVAEVTMIAADGYAGNFLTAYWRGQVDGAIAGDVTLRAWLSNPVGAAYTTDFKAILFAVPSGYFGDQGIEVVAATGTSTVVGPVPTEVSLTFPNVVTDDLQGRDLILQLHSTYINSGHIQVWHDSTTHPSHLEIPVLAPEDAPLTAPRGLQVTDGVGGGATLTWDRVDGAQHYLVERADAADGPFVEIGISTSPDFVDPAAQVRRTTYYRVRSVSSVETSTASEIVYATPVDDRPSVEVQFGLGPWESAVLDGADWSFTGAGGDGPVQVRASRWFTASQVAVAAN